MGTGGLEPPRRLKQRILSPSCLPISPHSHGILSSLTENYLESNRIVFCSKARSLMFTNNVFIKFIVLSLISEC